MIEMANQKILIIDDEKFFIQPIKLFLEKQGYDTIEAVDGLSGLSLARTENPNLIILDIMLPGFDGFQMCKLLKFDAKFKDIPIIMVSAKDTDRDKKLAKESGADLYLVKPVAPALLVENIKKLIG